MSLSSVFDVVHFMPTSGANCNRLRLNSGTFVGAAYDLSSADIGVVLSGAVHCDYYKNYLYVLCLQNSHHHLYRVNMCQPEDCMEIIGWSGYIARNILSHFSSSSAFDDYNCVGADAGQCFLFGKVGTEVRALKLTLDGSSTTYNMNSVWSDTPKFAARNATSKSIRFAIPRY